MAYGRYQFVCVDRKGNIVPGATVSVYKEVDGLLATIYSDRDGAVALGNPLTADSDGFAYFHAANGEYRIKVQGGGAVRDLRYVPIIYGGGVPGDNLIINGGFQINQRSFAGGASSAGAYNFDRWRSHGTDPATLSLSGYVLTLTSGTITQRIECAQWGVANFASTQITVSVENPADDLTITWGTVTGTITAGTGRRSVTITSASGDNSTSFLVLKIKKASGSGSTTFGRVKAELGSAATEWKPRPRTTEYELCQRYFWRQAGSAAYDVIGIGGTASSGTVQFFTDIKMPVRMRTTPSMTVADATKFTILAAGSTFASTAVALHGGVNQSPERSCIVVSATGMTTGQFGLMYSDGSTSNYIDWSAEL